MTNAQTLPKVKQVSVKQLLSKETDKQAKKVLNDIFSAAKVPTVSQYKVQVLQVNAKLKESRPTFASALKVLNVLMPDDTLPKVRNVVKAALKNDDKYNELKQVCKPSKSGKYSPFGILQAIYRLNK